MRKSTKIATLVASIVLSSSMAIGLTACGGNNAGGSQSSIEQQLFNIYSQYTQYAYAQGEAPVSYEAWLESIKGADGEAPVIAINDDGYWTVNGVSTGVLAQGIKGEDGAPGKDGEDGAPGKDGEDGAPGADGVGIAEIVDNKDGTMTIKLTNGTEQTITLPKGEDGATGATGAQGEAGPQGPAGEQGPAGPKGDKGEDGAAGADGVGIKSMEVVDGKLVVTLTDDSTMEVAIPNMSHTHAYGEWQIINMPGVDVSGFAVKVCEDCDNTKFQALPALFTYDELLWQNVPSGAYAYNEEASVAAQPGVAGVDVWEYIVNANDKISISIPVAALPEAQPGEPVQYGANSLYVTANANGYPDELRLQFTATEAGDYVIYSEDEGMIVGVAADGYYDYYSKDDASKLEITLGAGETVVFGFTSSAFDIGNGVSATVKVYLADDIPEPEPEGPTYTNEISSKAPTTLSLTPQTVDGGAYGSSVMVYKKVTYTAEANGQIVISVSANGKVGFPGAGVFDVNDDDLQHYYIHGAVAGNTYDVYFTTVDGAEGDVTVTVGLEKDHQHNFEIVGFKQLDDQIAGVYTKVCSDDDCSYTMYYGNKVGRGGEVLNPHPDQGDSAFLAQIKAPAIFNGTAFNSEAYDIVACVNEVIGNATGIVTLTVQDKVTGMQATFSGLKPYENQTQYDLVKPTATTPGSVKRNSKYTGLGAEFDTFTEVIPAIGGFVGYVVNGLEVLDGDAGVKASVSRGVLYDETKLDNDGFSATFEIVEVAAGGINDMIEVNLAENEVKVFKFVAPKKNTYYLTGDSNLYTFDVVNDYPVSDLPTNFMWFQALGQSYKLDEGEALYIMVSAKNTGADNVAGGAISGAQLGLVNHDIVCEDYILEDEITKISVPAMKISSSNTYIATQVGIIPNSDGNYALTVKGKFALAGTAETRTSGNYAETFDPATGAWTESYVVTSFVDENGNIVSELEGGETYYIYFIIMAAAADGDSPYEFQVYLKNVTEEGSTPYEFGQEEEQGPTILEEVVYSNSAVVADPLVAQDLNVKLTAGDYKLVINDASGQVVCNWFAAKDAQVKLPSKDGVYTIASEGDFVLRFGTNDWSSQTFELQIVKVTVVEEEGPQSQKISVFKAENVTTGWPPFVASVDCEVGNYEVVITDASGATYVNSVWSDGMNQTVGVSSDGYYHIKTAGNVNFSTDTSDWSNHSGVTIEIFKVVD